jgi:hypothetical protein
MPKVFEVGSARIPPRRSSTWVSAAVANARLAAFLVIFFVLGLAWIFGFIVFHVAGLLIHLLLIAAVVSLVVHLVRRV